MTSSSSASVPVPSACKQIYVISDNQDEKVQQLTADALAWALAHLDYSVVLQSVSPSIKKTIFDDSFDEHGVTLNKLKTFSLGDVIQHLSNYSIIHNTNPSEQFTLDNQVVTAMRNHLLLYDDEDTNYIVTSVEGPCSSLGTKVLLSACQQAISVSSKNSSTVILAVNMPDGLSSYDDISSKTFVASIKKTLDELQLLGVTANHIAVHTGTVPSDTFNEDIIDTITSITSIPSFTFNEDNIASSLKVKHNNPTIPSVQIHNSNINTHVPIIKCAVISSYSGINTNSNLYKALTSAAATMQPANEFFCSVRQIPSSSILDLSSNDSKVIKEFFNEYDAIVIAGLSSSLDIEAGILTAASAFLNHIPIIGICTGALPLLLAVSDNTPLLNTPIREGVLMPQHPAVLASLLDSQKNLFNQDYCSNHRDTNDFCTAQHKLLDWHKSACSTNSHYKSLYLDVNMRFLPRNYTTTNKIEKVIRPRTSFFNAARYHPEYVSAPDSEKPAPVLIEFLKAAYAHKLAKLESIECK